MKNKQKIIVSAALAAAVIFGFGQTASAMHIMEGYLPPKFCIAWGALSLPFLAAGFFSIQKTVSKDRRLMTILAMSGAFIFVISSLKIPSVTGSCSHMTGTGLGAILFGPAAVSVLGIIVLIFQAVLLAHGGLTTLPFLSFAIYKFCKKCSLNRRLSVFLAAMLGDIFTYCMTSIQLALSYPSEQGGFAASAVKFLGVFAPTQIPLAVIEGILTVVIIIALESYARPELKLLNFMKEGSSL